MSLAPDPERILTPTSLNRLVRQLLDDALPPVWIEAEISNLARPASGHLYFSLKDSGAQVRCAMFRTRSQTLAFRPADGQLVRVQGRVGLYEPRGDYQLIVSHMEEAGEGALQRAFEQLKRKLAAEGLLAAERKRPLPAFVRRLALITSPSGAAVRDVLTVIGRRFPLLPVDVLPAPVQGAEAVPMLRQRLREAIACGRYDAILFTRGGGSLEDLWAFNDEQLAREIAASPVLVVAAIGHEVDVTLAELAADLRAATPTAAAEALTPDRAELARRLAHARQRVLRESQRLSHLRQQQLDTALLRLRAVDPRRRLLQIRERAGSSRQNLERCLRQHLGQARSQLEALRRSLHGQQPGLRIERLRADLSRLHGQLQHGQRQQQAARRARMRELGRALHALSPLATLDRGYAIVQAGVAGTVLTSAAAIAGQTSVSARLADGHIELTVRADSLRLADAAGHD
ncbi:MAG: exodeoxyribonuclease VII large subunit [Xanthomonadales bacterium]|nr:exodeoxyribonuclease VII large subunit [Xanthomonadales bacterium]